ncbi:uncharacterized protein LOC111362713 isoform X1 [Spodoptera litura]|uniref:Uncharacterized protein LOC111362713 isoform X1 n=1 Tax=Spodoptera litura TaxID=69820 RepID=A0A9J7EUE1_SPOLT|nr:uncharacterized protein LOC111362713 isoform X1 [Spodoptera litura]
MAAALSSSVCVLLVILALPPPPMEAYVQAAEPGTYFWNRRTQRQSPDPGDAAAAAKAAMDDYNKKYDMDAMKNKKKNIQPITIINIRKNNKPTEKNFQQGYAVVIYGFKLTTAVLTIFKYAEVFGDAYPQFHPCYSDYWTTAYRWLYRYLKTLPEWATGQTSFIDTHKVWRKRYFYLNRFIPHWLRPFLIKLCVHPLTFVKEELVWKIYKKFAQAQWGKFYIYPSKVFNDYKSMRPYETFEQLDDSTVSND